MDFTTFITNKVDTNQQINISIIKGSGYTIKEMFDFINKSDSYKTYWTTHVGNLPTAQELYDIGYNIYDIKIGYFTIQDVWNITPKPSLSDLVKNFALVDIINYTDYSSINYVIDNLPTEKKVYNITGLNIDINNIPPNFEIIGYKLKDTYGDGWQGTEIIFNSVNINDDDEHFNDQLFIPDKADSTVPLDINYSYGAQNYYPFFTNSDYPNQANQEMNITGLLLIRRGTYNVISTNDHSNYNSEVLWNIIGQHGNIIIPEQIPNAPEYNGVNFNGLVTIKKSGCTNNNAVNYDASAEIDNGSCFVQGYDNVTYGGGVLRLNLPL